MARFQHPTPDDFVVSRHGVSGPARFLFATEDGTIAGWNPAVDPPARSSPWIGSTVDRRRGRRRRRTTRAWPWSRPRRQVPVRDQLPLRQGRGLRQPASPGQQLHRPHRPGRLRPVRHPQHRRQPVRHLRQAGRGQARTTTPRPGNGFVDVFAPDGTLLQRLASQGTLNSPWAVTLAPADLRRLRRRHPGRQLRRRPDQRLQPDDRRSSSASCEPTAARSRSTGCGGCDSRPARSTSPPAPCTSPPGPTMRPTGCSATSSPPRASGDRHEPAGCRRRRRTRPSRPDRRQAADHQPVLPSRDPAPGRLGRYPAARQPHPRRRALQTATRTDPAAATSSGRARSQAPNSATTRVPYRRPFAAAMAWSAVW